MKYRSRDHHWPCPGGCGELADECACRRPNPLGSIRVEVPIGSRLPEWHDSPPNVGDTARITRGPWTGFTGRVTAVHAAGWVSIQLAGFERTFATNEVEAIA